MQLYPSAMQIQASGYTRLAPWQKRAILRHIGRTKGGLNAKLYAIVNDDGKPIIMALIAGQVSDHIGAKILYPHLPNATVLIGGKAMTAVPTYFSRQLLSLLSSYGGFSEP
ncbi:MAG: hypothetical protein AAF352_05800 [Pseudomonadota bacterium]